MTGALTMAWDRGLALLLLLVTPGLGQRPPPTPGFPGLRHSYDCGVEGMQLLVLPPEGRTVRFKVMDEFGNQFEVNNCSSCYHWVTAKPQGPAVFSADYKGCHVLEKAGRAHLSVFIEALLPDGRVDVAQNLTLVCPKPAHSWTTPDGPLVPSTSFSPSTPHTHELSPTTEPSVSPPTPASPALGSGPTHPTRAGAQGATEDTGAFIVFRFPFTHCGTTVQAGAGRVWGGVGGAWGLSGCLGVLTPLSPPQVAGNQLIYENQLVSDVDVQVGPRGAITRDGSFR
ncbi:Zona pellucida sperm-binding protein 1 [Myotis davidii]|uniref:Zona pellucida sperm-binding protein 1 n=1 Tax=Myotis davidii TaxID=225400 RepID=L5LKR9_MYODS|nr:Zona pellucida sperm-binding protein 1 [Myotis davidii]